jgi:Protein of unknown function
MAVAGLPKADRVKFDDLLKEVVGALHFELLDALYDEHPDLKPPEEDREIPVIDSMLRWEEVRLPPRVSEADIDAIIFSVMKPQWRKVAVIVGYARTRCEELGIPISNGAVAARLQALAEANRIEDIDDLRKWRHSEVRLKD